MTSPLDARTLEQLLEAGEVAGALLLRGDFTDAERLLAEGAYRAGVEHGRSAALSDVQALLDAARHILAHGQLGKQSERRLRAALARFDSKDTA